MKKRMINKGLLLGIGVSLLTLTSCEKYLTQEPRNSTYNEAFWKNGTDVNSAVAANYALFRASIFSGNSQARHWMYGDAVANAYMTIQYTGDGLEGIQDGNWTFDYNLNEFGNYSNFYKTIAMSNLILKRLSEISDADLNVTNPAAFRARTEGQAYFLRGLTYFYMARVWGDVPIVTEVVDQPLGSPELPRDPMADVLKQAENDAQKALSLLDWTYTNNNDRAVTANKGSAYALLAHLYLWRATMTDVSNDNPIMEDVNSADTSINAIMNRNFYTLTDTANYYQTFIGKSNESIFEINNSEVQLEGSNRHIGMAFLPASLLNGASQRNFVKPGFLSTHFYKVADVWQWVWYANPGVWRWEAVPTRQADFKDVRAKKGFMNHSEAQPRAVKYQLINYRNPTNRTSAYMSNNTIIFRLADMKLLQAEIALYKNDVAKARTIVNEFRIRNGADVTALVPETVTRSEMFNEYMIERSKELFLEGHLFYDGLRTRQYSTYAPWLSTSRFRQEGYHWPLAPVHFKNNIYLRQTKYWRGKI
jgi:hypothetical protein